jgi:hypothetical protein
LYGGVAKIVDIKAYRTQSFEKRAFGAWQNRFKESFHQNTRIADLSHGTLYLLAVPGDDNAIPFYEVIMGILDLGEASEFFFLDDADKMAVVDIHLYLADHVRFEMMRRLGWIVRYPCQRHTVVEMVTQFKDINASCRKTVPELAKTHPDFSTYDQLITREKQVFIRKMLGDALQAFKYRVKP